MLGTGLHVTSMALEHARQARATAGEDLKEVEWLLELLNRQREVEERKEQGMRVIEKWPRQQLKMPHYNQVRVRLDDLPRVHTSAGTGAEKGVC